MTIIMTTNNNQNNPSKIERWENIEKVKWEGLPIKQDISEKLSQANDNYQPSTMINILKGINNRSKISFITNNEQIITPSMHDNLIKVVSSLDLLRASYEKLKRNKEAMTPGISGSTADSTSEKMLQEILQEILQEAENKKTNPSQKASDTKRGRRKKSSKKSEDL